MNNREHLKTILPKNFFNVCTFDDVYYAFVCSPYLDAYFTGIGGFILDAKDNVLCKWDLEHDDIDCQSEETVEFIYNLIINQKIVPNITITPKILEEYDLLLQIRDKMNKLIEQNICPDCKEPLDKEYDRGVCASCGCFYD